jgi:hypothetical protein
MEWSPSDVTWTQITEPLPGLDPDLSFQLVINCRSVEERESIAVELEKHGIKCTRRSE